MPRAQVYRAYLGSLKRRVRDATCARSSGVHPFFSSLLHWGSRRSARGRISGSRVACLGTHPSQLASQESASRRRAMRRRKRARSTIGAFWVDEVVVTGRVKV